LPDEPSCSSGKVKLSACYFAHPKRKLVQYGKVAGGQGAWAREECSMDAWTREELLDFLNLMLEAERAGARALLHVANDTREADISAMAAAIQKDEAHWCAMLIGAIKTLGGAPSEATGAFYDKVMALKDDKERLALVNRGQDWVVRKLREALPRIEDGALAKDLSVMLASHEDNIAKVARSGLVG